MAMGRNCQASGAIGWPILSSYAGHGRQRVNKSEKPGCRTQNSLPNGSRVTQVVAASCALSQRVAPRASRRAGLRPRAMAHGDRINVRKIKRPGPHSARGLGCWHLERVRGIEPPLSTWELHTCPLGHSFALIVTASTGLGYPAVATASGPPMARITLVTLLCLSRGIVVLRQR